MMNNNSVFDLNNCYLFAALALTLAPSDILFCKFKKSYYLQYPSDSGHSADLSHLQALFLQNLS